MGNGARAKCLAQVIEVPPEQQPCSNQSWQGDQNSECENEADDLGWGLGICSEDVVDLWLAGVAFWCRRDHWWALGVILNLDVEGMASVWGRGSEGAQGYRSLEWLGACEELEREVLWGLQPKLLALSSVSRDVFSMHELCAYHIDLGLAIVLHTERERLFQSSLCLLQGKESLVWLLARLSLLCSEDYFQRRGSWERDW